MAELHAAPALVLNILSFCMTYAVMLLTGIRLIALIMCFCYSRPCYCSVWWFLCSCCFPTPRPLFCQSRLCSLGQCCAVDQSCVAGRGCLLMICCASSRQCGVGVAVVCWCDLREDCPVCMSHVLDCGERWLSVTAGDFLSLTDVCLLENVNWWRSFMLRLLLF